MSRAARTNWLNVPADPDPWHDLEYELVPLTVIGAETVGDQVMFLPGEADGLRDEAFIVASADSVRSLDTCQ